MSNHGISLSIINGKQAIDEDGQCALDFHISNSIPSPFYPACSFAASYFLITSFNYLVVQPVTRLINRLAVPHSLEELFKKRKQLLAI